MINPYAAFDCLLICDSLEGLLGTIAIGELHLFSYLSCLLSLFEKRPAADWGYAFAGTQSGSPFSPEIESAVAYLKRDGLLTGDAEYVALTDQGRNLYRSIEPFSENKRRARFVEAACSSALAVPVGMVRYALSQEPVLRAAATGSTRALEEGPGLQALYEQFGALATAIGFEAQDLMVPAVVWIKYLQHMSECTQEMAGL